MQANKRHVGLGRGLGDLLQRTDPELPPPAEPTDDAAPLVEVAGAYFAEVPIAGITPNPKQPRHVFDEDALGELVDSIREVGLLQPVVVRPLGDDKYELVMGERRLRASTLAGLATIPAIVRPTEVEDLLRDALMENLHRVQLNPLEEAAAYKQMLEDFGCTQDELAVRVKRSRPQISNTIRLLRLPAQVQRRVAAGVLSAGHARALLVLDDVHAQERLATRIVAEGLSVRSVEEIVAVGERPLKERKSRSLVPDPRAASLQEQLTDLLDTKVQVTIGKARGKIVIDFGDGDDLDRVLNAMGIAQSLEL
ncbi:MAG: ParB/RepB/Spo0J family partition protein [Propionibacteriaceae bacterium]|nr:ParB/RepB/Spo0J family partition protein [Micropruina sp.]HBX80058.1 chromosome partitioning protein ParB [Propionibacteriaceae bacterium]HBY21788.1 chromosome partitioning protein ParB [Propionibacteriaceae bacterium]